MAPHRRLKTLPDARRDLISELPVEVKDKILECLPTRDAARTALLSRHWNDVWLQHGGLVLDRKFLESVQQRQDDRPVKRFFLDGRSCVNIINNILFLRAGPVKKFILRLWSADPMPQQSDFDRWCRFLSRNGVEELNICLYNYQEPQYQLPFCLLSCRTIKQLIVEGPFIDLPVNACDIFSNVTSLKFMHVEFKRGVNGIASSIGIPKLEKLAFKNCVGIDKFEINPPKLEILSIISSIEYVFESRWLAPHLKVIKSLCLCGSLLMSGLKDEREAASRLLEDPDNCVVIQKLKMLNTIKTVSYRSSALNMLFIIMLLSKSPALERFIVKFWCMNAPEVRKIQRMLERIPRASSYARIVCLDIDKVRQSFYA